MANASALNADEFPVYRNLFQLHDLCFDALSFNWTSGPKMGLCYILNEVAITQLDLLKTGFEYSSGNERLIRTFKIGEGIARVVQVCLGIYLRRTDTLVLTCQIVLNLLNIGEIALSILKPKSDKINSFLSASQILQILINVLLLCHRHKDTELFPDLRGRGM